MLLSSAAQRWQKKAQHDKTWTISTVSYGTTRGKLKKTTKTRLICTLSFWWTNQSEFSQDFSEVRYNNTYLCWLGSVASVNQRVTDSTWKGPVHTSKHPSQGKVGTRCKIANNTCFKLAIGYRLVYKAGWLSAQWRFPVLIKHQGVVGQLVCQSRNSCRKPIKVVGL